LGRGKHGGLMTLFHYVRHLASDRARDGADHLGVAGACECLQPMVLGRVKMFCEITSHGEKLVFDHAISIIVVDSLNHKPSKWVRHPKN